MMRDVAFSLLSLHVAPFNCLSPPSARVCLQKRLRLRLRLTWRVLDTLVFV